MVLLKPGDIKYSPLLHVKTLIPMNSTLTINCKPACPLSTLIPDTHTFFPNALCGVCSWEIISGRSETWLFPAVIYSVLRVCVPTALINVIVCVFVSVLVYVCIQGPWGAVAQEYRAGLCM